ncbi:MAG: aminoacetone oxidase family FAD-binding enzyme, partial [Eubacterium sp.]|nr:aminoacetone oxidase family FAD-binding enzyme [Eubacterium sp.]
APQVIVATGGKSYPSTGSTGDGYRFARESGHEVTDLIPGLVPMNIKEKDCQEMQGLSMKNVELTYVDVKSGKTIYSGFGEMMFTHFGITGPLVLSASSVLGKARDVKVILDCKPALDDNKLDKRILRDFSERPNYELKNVLGALLPRSMVPVVIKRSGIDASKKVNSITKEERAALVNVIKRMEFSFAGFREFREAIITRGGVSIKDINPHTMESKYIKGLYFAGEVIDVDALTGGFNLQIAWSTGALAGSQRGE